MVLTAAGSSFQTIRKAGKTMKGLLKRFFIGTIILTLLLTGIQSAWYPPYDTVTVQAHSGRTDSSGGHRDNKNKSGLGSYHYHCGGNPAHLHDKGVCPYENTAVKAKSSGTKKDTSQKSGEKASETKISGTKTQITKSVIKKVQTKLNELGYDCGKADGKAGKNTKKALKKFQEDNGLKVDGVIGKEVLKSLEIK